MFRKWLERVNLSFWKKTTILCHCLSQISSYVENHRTLFLAQRPLNIESAFLTPEFETCKRQRPFYESLHVGAYHRSALKRFKNERSAIGPSDVAFVGKISVFVAVRPGTTRPRTC